MVIKFDFRHKKIDGDLLLTVACPVECNFCVYSCTASKEPWKWMPEETIRRVAEEYSKNGIGIRISGGEPFYDLQKLERCIDILLQYYKPFEILAITSGFFAFDKENAEKHIGLIKEKKIDTLVVSVDRFHLRRVPLTNIQNIIEVCNKMDIEVALRISLDSSSFPLIDKVSELIVKHKLPIEVHTWGNLGRGEKLGDSTLKNRDFVEKYIFSKISELARKNNSPPDSRYYLTETPKRSQRKYASEFFPTTFPNGNVYACSVTAKGCYMGNIGRENLLDMIFKFKGTFPGNFVVSDLDCRQLIKFLPNKFKHNCEFCKNRFFISSDKHVDEAVGREFIKIIGKTDLNMLFNQLLEKKKYVTKKEYERELLISFRLTQKDLNEITGKKIKNFLQKLEDNKIRFVLSRPLPLCLGKINDDTQPKNCFECREMFTVEEGIIRYCEPLGGIEGYKLEWLKDRNQIYGYFEIEHNKLKLTKKCENCLFRIRNNCNGMCFNEK